jgi:hypothetical protein
MEFRHLCFTIFVTMIIEQNIFHLKFGKAKEAIEIWKQIGEVMKKDGRFNIRMRILTDLTGPAYTLIFELNIHSYMEINPMMYVWKTNQQARELYQQFIPLCESGHRELYKIEMET